MLKANVSKTQNQGYTIDHAVSDFGKLLPYLHPEFAKYGALTKCCYCGGDVPVNTGSSVATFYPNEAGNERADVLAVCKSCTPSASQQIHQLNDIEGIVISSNEQERIDEIILLRNLAVKVFADKVGYPVVSKSLLCDKTSLEAILFTKDKVYPAFIPLLDSDPFIIGGRIAKDALAVYKSIEAGKSEVTFLFGKPVLNANDEELLRELSKGSDL